MSETNAAIIGKQGDTAPRAGMLAALSRNLPRLRSSAFTIGDQCFVSACNFATTALIARALGLEAFGWYTLAWLAVSFALNIQLGLIVSPMMSIGSKQDPVEADRFFSVVMVHEVVFCALAMAGIGLTVSWLLWTESIPGTGFLTLAAMAAGGAFLAQDFARRVFYTRMRPHLVLAIDAVNQLVKLACLALFWRKGVLDMQGVLWIIAGAATLSTLCSAVTAGHHRFDLSGFGQITARQWRSGRWLAGTGLMQWVNANIALIMIGGLLGPSAVGALRVAQSLLGVLNIAREALENFLPQQASHALAAGGTPQLRRLLMQTAIFSVIVGGCVVLTLAFLGGEILHFVYGSGFGQYGFVIGWLSLSFPLALLIMDASCAFRALEHTSPIFTAVTGAALFNLVAAYPTVSLFGIDGAIGVIVASDCVILTLLVLQLLRTADTAA